MTTTYEQLKDNLQFLGLNEMIVNLDETIDFVNNNHLTFTDGLIHLTNYERDHKQKNLVSSMIKVAGFPFLKELKDFDFSFQPELDENKIRDLATLRFIENKENIVFVGNSGVGKTHLATSLGIIAAKNRVSTYFIKCNDLLNHLHRARLENRLEARLKQYAKYKLLIIDEIGYLPIDKEDAKYFFQLIDMRYEMKSTILTTNIGFNKWDDVFKDTLMANAILDRILHHSSVITITGNSYRLKDYINLED